MYLFMYFLNNIHGTTNFRVFLFCPTATPSRTKKTVTSLKYPDEGYEERGDLPGGQRKVELQMINYDEKGII